nr:transmembrane protein 255B [Danio rerio]|eukprot:XP_009303535.1 transmembrane protein 255B [Danio rerio]
MQQQQPSADPADVFMKRRRTALWCSVSLFALSVLVLVIGLLSATHTDNVAVSGYYPGIILSFGSFLSVVGLNLVENRRPMLVASIIFISLGVVSCFLCSIIDGIIAAEFIVSLIVCSCVYLCTFLCVCVCVCVCACGVYCVC